MTQGNYETTPYYNLPIYQAQTPQDLRDGYNKAMYAIDKKLHQLDVQIDILKNK